MKRTKKMLLVAISAIAAMAFAGSASASAADWVLPELSKATETSYSGSMKFDIREGNESVLTVSCDAELDATLKPGSSGSLDDLRFQACSIEQEGLEECDIGVSAEETKQPIKAEDAAIRLDSMYVGLTSSNCGFDGLSLPNEPVVFSPNNPKAISSLAVSANTPWGEGLQTVVSGTLNAGDPGAYGIGVGDRWTTNDPPPIASPASIEVDGSLGVGWSLYGNGFECTHVHGTATLLPGGEAQLGELEVDPAWCGGFGPGYNGCEVEDAYARSEGAVEATSSGNVRFEEALLLMNGISGCESAQPWYVAAWGEVNAHPDDSSQISALKINEYVSTETGFGLAGGVMTGTLNITPTGKYGISG